MKVHFTPKYLLNPQHAVTVDLIGVGGTGSKVLSNLARLNYALMALGHPGLHVRAWDDDVVTEANIGRQLFSPADVGGNKAAVLITRVNGFFGFDWEAETRKYIWRRNETRPGSNITISCVDTAAARILIAEVLAAKTDKKKEHVSDKRFYWLDIGNRQQTGQVVLGTVSKQEQPKSDFETTDTLKNVVQKFPGLKKIKEEDQGPSCSLAEALNKQDLFINSLMAEYAVNLLWKLFREGKIISHGVFVNLATLVSQPIAI